MVKVHFKNVIKARTVMIIKWYYIFAYSEDLISPLLHVRVTLLCSITNLLIMRPFWKSTPAVTGKIPDNVPFTYAFRGVPPVTNFFAFAHFPFKFDLFSCRIHQPFPVVSQKSLGWTHLTTLYELVQGRLTDEVNAR